MHIFFLNISALRAFILQGGLGVSSECFGHLTHLLTSVSNLSGGYSDNEEGRSPPLQDGGIVLALEGGYNLA